MPVCGALLALAGSACSPRLDVGSDVLWVARFEGNSFDEWNGAPGGRADVPVPPDTSEISSEHPRNGAFAAKLTVNAGSDGAQHNVGLGRKGSLPAAAYYSAWYYIPRTIAVGGFWVIFKFRQRAAADDAGSEGELFDIDLKQTPAGEMTLELYDFRIAGARSLDVPEPILPVGVWFQIEAFYRNAADASGRLTIWLDGQQVVDLSGEATSPTAWTEWDVVNVAKDLNPSPTVLFVDDCAISFTRVGPTGILAR